MASLLSDTDKAYFTGVLGDLFDTFKRTITVHKEPQKKIVNPALDIYAGYAETSTVGNIEYVHVSQVFDAMISYVDRSQSSLDSDLNVNIPKNASVRIKVKDDCRNYIKNGRTEKIEIDGKSFNVIGRDSVKYNFGYYLYVFYLEETT